MRSDMSKVIVERPRWGSRQRSPRRTNRLDPKQVVVGEDGDDPFPRRIGHKRAVAGAKCRKSLSEHLQPLRRYLHKQAGRPWSKVFAEIARNISLDNAVQKHVRDHVDDFVAVEVREIDGVLHYVDRYGGLEPLCDRRRWRPELYVHPRTGILLRNVPSRAERTRESQRRAEAKRALAARLRILAPDRQLHLLDDGNWWEVTLATGTAGYLGSRPTGDPAPVDVVDRANLSSLPREERYGRGWVYAVAKRPLSRKEIRALALRG